MSRAPIICTDCGIAMTDHEVEGYVDQCEFCANNLCTEDCPEDCMADHRGEL